MKPIKWLQDQRLSVCEEEMTNFDMYLIYVDESYDETHYAYSALFISAFRWNEYFNYLLEWRMDWFNKHQVALDTELHPTNFIDFHLT